MSKDLINRCRIVLTHKVLVGMRAELGDDIAEHRLVFQLLVVVEQTLHLHRVLAFFSNLVLQVLHKNELGLDVFVESGERTFYFSEDMAVRGRGIMKRDN